MNPRRTMASLLLLSLLAFPVAASAQDGLSAEVTVQVSCAAVTFESTVEGGQGPYTLTWDFGDGEVQTEAEVAGFPWTVLHDYAAAGEFEWSVSISDASEPALQAMASGVVSLGPTVALTSDIFPPLLTLSEGQASLNFTAEVTGGSPPFAFAWDLDGDGVFEDGAAQASYSYTQAGKFEAAVRVTDACGLVGLDTLTVVVVDPEEACHPMAQRIADGVSSLFPSQATQMYTCQDIFDIFEGGLTGYQLGFGRMWHAYQLAATLEDLTWEEILDWQLAGTGWGLLVQLDRFSETLGDVGLRDLIGLVLSGEASVGEIRTAVRMATRYEAGFEDALSRLAAGANPGALGQFYRAVEDLGLAPEALDGYLEQGLSLAELRHAARVAEQTGGDWMLAAEAHAAGDSWGQIRRELSGDDATAGPGNSGEEHGNPDRTQDREQRQEESNARIASRLAERYRISAAEVLRIHTEVCGGDWPCTRARLAEMYGGGRGNPGGGNNH